MGKIRKCTRFRRNSGKNNGSLLFPEQWKRSGSEQWAEHQNPPTVTPTVAVRCLCSVSKKYIHIYAVAFDSYTTLKLKTMCIASSGAPRHRREGRRRRDGRGWPPSPGGSSPQSSLRPRVPVQPPSPPRRSRHRRCHTIVAPAAAVTLSSSLPWPLPSPSSSPPAATAAAIVLGRRRRRRRRPHHLTPAGEIKLQRREADCERLKTY